MGRRMLVAGAALVTLLSNAAPSYAVVNTFNLGTLQNDSLSFPSVKTVAGTNMDYFWFTLPVDEFVTASLSISGPITDQLTGSFTLHTKAGAIIEATWVTPHIGGETATLGNFSPSGDFLTADKYYVEVDGTVPVGTTLRLAVDGNVTAIAGVPEPSTWAMMLLGFAGLGYAARRRHVQRIAHAQCA